MGWEAGELAYWDKLAIENGNYLTKKREKLVEFINVGQFMNCPYTYRCLRSLRNLAGALKQYAQAEVAATSTLVGPHRDDLQFFDNTRNLKNFRKSGRTKMAILFLKIKRT